MRKIDKITVIEGDQRIETQFLGLFRDFGGFLIKAKTVTGEPAALVDEGPLPRGKIFYSLSVRRRYGRRFDEVEYNRYLDVAKSYKEARYPVPRKPLRAGDFLADADGRLLGFCAPFRREDRDEILARQRNSAGHGAADETVSLLRGRRGAARAAGAFRPVRPADVAQGRTPAGLARRRVPADERRRSRARWMPRTPRAAALAACWSPTFTTPRPPRATASSPETFCSPSACRAAPGRLTWRFPPAAAKAAGPRIKDASGARRSIT